MEPIVNFGIGAVADIIAGLTDGAGSMAIAVLFAGANYDSVAFCGAGDVGDPGMTANDWADAINYAEPQLNIPAVQKARQWFQHVIYPTLCQCSDGTVPPPTVTTAPPVVDNPSGQNPAPIGGNCWDKSGTKSSLAPNTPIVWTDMLPQLPVTYSNPPQGVTGIQSPLPSSLVTTMTVGTEGSNALAMQYQVTFYGTAGNVISGGGSINNIAPGAGPQSHSWAIPTTAANWAIGSENNVGSSTVATNNVTLEATIYCQGQSPNSVQSPCCPPDPSVDLRLAALFDMMQQLLSLQSLQGAYQDTVRHAGLSGNGTISINPASSAIRVEVRTDLSNWPHNVQTPNYYYSLGFVTPYAVGTPLKGQRLVYNNQTFTWPSYTDQIGYAIAPGLVVDLVELTRGA